MKRKFHSMISINFLSKNVSDCLSSCAAYTAATALHKMSDHDATTTMSNLVDAGDDDVQIVNSMLVLGYLVTHKFYFHKNRAVFLISS